MIFENITDFNTDHIFDCGQCFRWEREEDGSYTGVTEDRIANISYEEGTLRIEEPKGGLEFGSGIDFGSEVDFGSGVDFGFGSGTGRGEDRFWRDYLDLDRDYGEIKADLATRDSVLRHAIPYGEGIRILRQDPWETLISFIISSKY